jgi:glycerophosphoryl diester phosphodiesterase
MPRIAFILAGLAAAALAACGRAEDPTRGAATDLPAAAAGAPAGSAATRPAAAPKASASKDTPLNKRLDCLRENGGTLVIAHRGGPTRDFPENAIETFERTLAAGTHAIEIDIAESRDGVLFLMHDDDLARTSTGEGSASETSWADIETVKLETYSQVTTFSPPTLDAALQWIVANDVVAELDKKRSTSFEKIIDAVERAGARDHVFVITYTDQQAIDVHRRAPNLMITATVESLEQLDRLIAAGVNPDHLLAWTGTQAPNAQLWQVLNDRGVESIFGTLGRRGERLDDAYWEDNDGSEYDTLAEDGLTLLVTDLSDKVSRQLADTETAPMKACGW